MTAVRSGFRRVGLVAAAAALAVSSCASDEPQAPVEATAEETAELASQQPDNTPTTTAPQTPETTTAPQTPETTTADAVEAGAEPAECEEGQHSHDGEGCHGHSDTTDGANGSGGDSGAVCEDGLTRFEDLVTEEDNGCRPEVCDDGRGDDGHCLFAEEELTEEEAAALEDIEPLPWEEYGLDGCTEVALGVCDLDGVLHCHNTITGWAECPGGGTAAEGSCPAVEPDDPFAFTGPLLANEAVPLVLMEEGTWRIDACVRGNDLTTGEPSRFTVSLFTPPNEEGRGKGGVLFDEEAVVNGEWTTEIYLVWGEYEPLPFELWVTPVGGGTWTVHIIAVSA